MTAGSAVLPAVTEPRLAPAAAAPGPEPGATHDRVIGAALIVMALFVSRIAVAESAYAVALIAWLTHPRRALRVVPRALVLPLAGFVALTVLSAAFSLDPSRSLPRLSELSLYAIPLLIANHVRTRRQVDALMKAIMAQGMVLALWGIVQFERASNERQRIQGPAGHWMTYSGILALAVTVAMGYAVYHPCRRTRVVSAAAAAVMALGVLLSLTRGAWLALFVAAVALVLLRRPLLLAALPPLLLVVTLAAPQPVVMRLSTLMDLKEDVTWQDRLSLWRGGLHIIADHPLLGAGPGMVRSEYERYRDPAAPLKMHNHLHDDALQIAAERGVPALLCWIALFVAVAAGAVTALRRSRGWVRAPLAAGFLAVCCFQTFGLIEWNFGDSEVAILLLALLALPGAALGAEAAGAGADASAANMETPL